MTKYELAIGIITYFEQCKLTAYKCPAGLWTIGYGSTKDVINGMTIAQGEANERLKKDLHDSEMRIVSMLKVPVNDNYYAALLSLGFNLTYKSMITLTGHLNKDEKRFREKMLLYCKGVNGKFLKGLKIRRICERLLCEDRDWKPIAKELQPKQIKIDYISEREKELFNA
jgi:lysozyme